METKQLLSLNIFLVLPAFICPSSSHPSPIHSSPRRPSSEALSYFIALVSYWKSFQLYFLTVVLSGRPYWFATQVNGRLLLFAHATLVYMHLY